MGLAAPDDPVGDLELLLGRDLRGLLAPPPQADWSVFLEAMRELSEEPIVDAVLPLLDGGGEPGDLVVLGALLGPVRDDRAEGGVSELSPQLSGCNRPLHQLVFGEFKVGGVQRPVLLIEQVWIEEQLPGLVLAPHRRQGVALEVFPVLLEGAEADRAGRRDADLDDPGPLLVLESLRLLLKDTSHRVAVQAPVVEREVVLVLALRLH